MKKSTTILVLLLVLSFSVFAEEGQIPFGGRTCPQSQTCLTEGQIPASGKSCPQDQTCSTDGTTHSGGRIRNLIIENIFDYLKSIFS